MAFMPLESGFDASASGLYNPRKRKTEVMEIAKVLLTETVENVGHVGEIVDVANGFARNYLMPRGLAVEPTEHNISRFAKAKAAHEAELLKREEKAKLLSDKLSDLMLTFERKAHDDDRLYGSVRAEDITSQIEEKFGEHIETSRVQMERPIETLGPHVITINLYKGISADVRVQVNEENAKPEPAQEAAPAAEEESEA